MATQYTAGLSAGQILTAATMNSIGAVWETYTPTYTATSGTLTTVTTNAARWARLQKTFFLHIDATITNVGTATGFLEVSLPAGITPQKLFQVGVAKEMAVNGNAGTFQITSNTKATFYLYAAGNTAVVNYRMAGLVIFEVA